MLQKNKIFFWFTLTFLYSLSCSLFAEPVSSLMREDNNPIAGNPKGKITIVEFFDYQCSHCITMTKVIDTIIKENPDVRIIYKDFPIRGPMSDLAARTAIAANKQGKYVSVSHGILGLSQPLTENKILDAAKDANVNLDRLKKDMNSSNVVKQIKSNFDLAAELKIPGTPAFYIGKTNAKDMTELQFVIGEMNQLELQKAINDQRQLIEAETKKSNKVS